MHAAGPSIAAPLRGTGSEAASFQRAIVGAALVEAALVEAAAVGLVLPELARVDRGALHLRAGSARAELVLAELVLAELALVELALVELALIELAPIKLAPIKPALIESLKLPGAAAAVARAGRHRALGAALSELRRTAPLLAILTHLTARGRAIHLAAFTRVLASVPGAGAVLALHALAALGPFLTLDRGAGWRGRFGLARVGGQRQQDCCGDHGRAPRV